MAKEIDTMTKTKIAILSKRIYGFYARYILNVPFHWSNDIATACTDYLRVFFNQGFWDKLTPDERIFLVLHEILHIAYGHNIRMPSDESYARLWNMAADYRINYDLVELGLTMPKGGLYDAKYAIMSTEEIFHDLKSNPNSKQATAILLWVDLKPLTKEAKENADKGAGTGDADEDLKNGIGILAIDAKDGTPLSAEDLQKLEAQLEKMVVEANLSMEMTYGKDAGKVPAHLQRVLDKLLKPKVNWQQILKNFFWAVKPNYYSWSKRNRRRIHHGYYPGQTGETLSRVDFAIDVSGSISKDMFTQFISELATVFMSCAPEKIGVYQFEAGISGFEIVKNKDEMLKIEFNGGGGTCVKEVFDKFRTDIEPLGLVVLTDGYIFDLHELKKPSRPVIWVIWDNPNFVPPFGQVVHFTLN